MVSAKRSQARNRGEIARPAHGRRCDRRWRESIQAAHPSTSEPRRGRKPVECLIGEAAIAYREGTNAGIPKLLDEWEGKIKQEDESDEEMENWREVISDPKNTRADSSNLNKLSICTSS